MGYPCIALNLPYHLYRVCSSWVMIFRSEKSIHMYYFEELLAESRKGPKKSQKTGKALQKISRKLEKAKKAVERGKKKLRKTGKGPLIAGPLLSSKGSG